MNFSNTSNRFKIAPCKECQERYSGCHGSCQKYIDWKTKRDEESNLIYQEKQKNSQIIGFEVARSRRISKICKY